ncbi:MAG: tripartite transporter [Rhodobiaceae bacterium]|nr:tripartite transporter [Rhodobiaceae bacterium]OUT90055.1 MAG: tripartite transporter [Rhizobiales bacterium TMED29]
MFAAACLVLLLGFPVAFTLAGVALAFGFIGQSLDIFDIGFFYALPQRIYGTMTNEVLIAVPLFVFMGTMLERARVAEDLLENMSRLFAGVRGGLGISVSIVGALLAASTGIVGATVVTMSLLSLPTMLRRGYAPSLAAGSIAAAGTLGQIIPPSIVLVLLGDVIANAYQKAQLEQGIFAPETVSVGELFSGSLIPGLVLVGLYIIYQVGLAIFKPSMAPPAEYDDDLVLSDLLGALFAPIFLIISVLGSILAGIATPTEAAAVGAVGTILLAGHKLGDRKKLMVAGALSVILVVALTSTFDLRLERDNIATPDLLAIGVALALCGVIVAAVGASLLTAYRLGVLESTMRSTTHTTSMVFVILIGAALFSLVFRGLGGDDTIHDLLQSLPGGTWTAVAVVMLVMFLLGFFLDFIEIIFVVVPLVGPVLLGMGVDPVWLGVMMAINLQTSFLTPPFGFALFYLRGAAPESVSTGDIYRGAIPFVIIQLIMLALLAWIPEMATWLPEVVFGD